MLVEESDARKRWCPASRVINKEGSGGGNRWDGSRPEDAPNGSLCLGSSCMAWRWAGWETTFNTVAVSPRPEDRIGDLLGYCGLAGTPPFVSPSVE